MMRRNKLHKDLKEISRQESQQVQRPRGGTELAEKQKASHCGQNVMNKQDLKVEVIRGQMMEVLTDHSGKDEFYFMSNRKAVEVFKFQKDCYALKRLFRNLYQKTLGEKEVKAEKSFK